jgi:hypothetical protein
MGPGRIVAYVLCVPALELSDPVAMLVHMKSGYASVDRHRSHFAVGDEPVLAFSLIQKKNAGQK